eukprot:TRINITY_DN7364_c0_g2_i1.p1 TRINITY_DN7364_c0_g2~~TRINITY_DN7364_c0_g2_i1.p1  ORF type:complete len:550 (-),score=113.93 TRINITY_DN7364_c0_g2_i1:146-1795(-)
MIEYEEGKWRPLFSLKGSVLQKAAKWAFPFAFLTAGLGVLIRSMDANLQPWLASMDIGDRLRDFSFILGFLIVFRSQKAYSRWWEGGTLLQQLRGEWFNAFSSLLAFTNPDPEIREEVERFQHQLARMMSLLYSNALKQVSAMEDNSFELIDIQGFDLDSLEYILQAHDSCEVVLQWVQRLIVEANTRDIIRIAPPILSRVYNQLGNGIVRLNNARKIRQFPIPFPLAQMVALMLVSHAFITSVVISINVEAPYLAAALTFIVILCFWSINYISTELEQPYGDDANDLPLHGMMEDLNKSLCALLNPTALSPPDFAYNPEHDARLYKSKVDMNSYVEDLINSGKARRRRTSTHKPSKETKSVTPEPMLTAEKGTKAGRGTVIGAQQAPVLAASAPNGGEKIAVDTCMEGLCTEGSCDQGQCSDKEYRDSLLLAQPRKSEGQKDLQVPPGEVSKIFPAKAPAPALEALPPGAGQKDSQQDHVTIDLNGVHLEPPSMAPASGQVVVGAAERKAMHQIHRRSVGLLSECMPCSSLAGRRSGGSANGGSLSLL